MPLPPHLGFEAVFRYPRFNPNSDIYFFSEFRTAERRIYRHECSTKGKFLSFRKTILDRDGGRRVLQTSSKKRIFRVWFYRWERKQKLSLPCGEKERERRMLKKRWKNRGEWKEKRRRRKRVVAKQVLAVSSTLLQLSLFDASSGHPL